MGTDKVYVFYLDSEGSGLNTKTLGFACDTSGAFLWLGDIVTLSNPTTEKLQMATAMDVYKNCKLAWGDRRLDASGIYAQDINPSGQLGQPVIPVELTSFAATIQGNAVHLRWSTSTETNNKGFEIERLPSSKIEKFKDWELIGFVEGTGSTTQPVSYSFINENVQPGVHHYKLKQIDYDGTFDYSNSIEVEIIFLAEFSLYQNYPNPFNPSTIISYQLPVSGDVTLKIYDVLGNEILTLVDDFKPAGKYEVEFNPASSIKNPASGIYFYQLKAGDFSETKQMLLLK